MLRALIATAILTCLPAFCQPDGGGEAAKKQLEYTRGHYTKYDYRIPMRDGVKLFTSVYIPKDATQPQPLMMQRTPYSVAPYGADKFRRNLGPSKYLMKDGYIFVY